MIYWAVFLFISLRGISWCYYCVDGTFWRFLYANCRAIHAVHRLCWYERLRSTPELESTQSSEDCSHLWHQQQIWGEGRVVKTTLKSESEVAQSCPSLCDPMDCSLPGSSVHQIFQARVLEWVAISFSRTSSQPRHWTQVSRFNHLL